MGMPPVLELPMSRPMERKLSDKLQDLFEERVSSLLEDGYVPVVKSSCAYFHYARLRHPNGNVVTIKGYPRLLQLIQLTNGNENYRVTIA